MHQAEDRLSGCKDKDLDKGPRQNKQRVWKNLNQEMNIQEMS